MKTDFALVTEALEQKTKITESQCPRVVDATQLFAKHPFSS